MRKNVPLSVEDRRRLVERGRIPPITYVAAEIRISRARASASSLANCRSAAVLMIVTDDGVDSRFRDQATFRSPTSATAGRPLPRSVNPLRVSRIDLHGFRHVEPCEAWPVQMITTPDSKVRFPYNSAETSPPTAGRAQSALPVPSPTPARPNDTRFRSLPRQQWSSRAQGCFPFRKFRRRPTQSVDRRYSVAMQSLYDHAGGAEAIHRLEEVFYAKVLVDPKLHRLFPERVSTHVDHLTAFTSETFGGPDAFSRDLGFQYLIDVHRGLKITEEERQRFVELYLEAAAEVDFPDDPPFRQAFLEHLDFGSRVAMQNSNAETDDQLHPLRHVPKWTWPEESGSHPS